MDKKLNAELESRIEQILIDLDSKGLLEVESKVGVLFYSIIEELESRITNPKLIKKIEGYVKSKINYINHKMLMHKVAHKLNPEKREDLNLSRLNFQRTMKRFMVYEVYKILNPRRISGETKRDNFIHNVIVGGLKRAARYENKKDLKNMPKAMLQGLDNIHKKSVSKGLSINF